MEEVEELEWRVFQSVLYPEPISWPYMFPAFRRCSLRGISFDLPTFGLWMLTLKCSAFTTALHKNTFAFHVEHTVIYSIHFHEAVKRTGVHWLSMPQPGQDLISASLFSDLRVAVKPLKCPENKQTRKGHQPQCCLSLQLIEINCQATSGFITLLQQTLLSPWAGTVSHKLK